jgi:hypothetical protein
MLVWRREAYGYLQHESMQSAHQWDQSSRRRPSTDRTLTNPNGWLKWLAVSWNYGHGRLAHHCGGYRRSSRGGPEESFVHFAEGRVCCGNCVQRPRGAGLLPSGTCAGGFGGDRYGGGGSQVARCGTTAIRDVPKHPNVVSFRRQPRDCSRNRGVRTSSPGFAKAVPSLQVIGTSAGDDATTESNGRLS